jgi:hypothetical protein
MGPPKCFAELSWSLVPPNLHPNVAGCRLEPLHLASIYTVFKMKVNNPLMIYADYLDGLKRLKYFLTELIR